MAAKDAITAPLGSMSSYLGSGFGYGSPEGALEHVPDLLYPTSVPTYARMRTDPVVSSILAAYVGPLLAADWRIDPRGADPAAVKICCDSLGIPAIGEDTKDIGAVRRRGVHWIEHVRLASLHLLWGHFAFFPYYEVRADGHAYLAGLPERMPSTIVEIRVNDDGTLRSIVQEGVAGKPNNVIGGVELPAKDLLYYVNAREGAAWQGRSLVRNCYSDWLLKVEGKRANAVGLSRFSAGTPVAEPLPGTNPTPAQIAEAQRMVSSIRVGQQGGAVPVGFKIRIIGIEGTLPDALASLRYYNEEMRTSALASVLDLGSSPNGSRALGDVFADLLKNAIQGVADGMAETATQLCERLTSINFGEDAIPPAVTAGDVGASKAAIAASITGLVAAGLVTPDPSLERYVREGYHLPPKDPTPEPAPDPTAITASGWQPWVQAAGGADAHTGSEAKLVDWYVHGEGAARIRWGTAGDFDRCRAIAGKHMPPHETAGFCSNRHKEATGQWPGKGRVHASSGSEQTGIMVALMVPPAKAADLALKTNGAEPPESLHLTLVFLGDTKDVTDEAAYVGTVLNVIRDVASRHPVVVGQISGSGRFTTPDSDAVYLSYDSPDLPDLRQDLFESLKAAGIEPVANHGFSPHITLAYVPKGTSDPLDHVDVSDLTFAGITFAYGGQQITAPLMTPEWPPGAIPLTDEIAVSDFRVTAAAGDPKTYREPTPQEQAAGLDPQQIDAEHDALVAEGMALFAAIVAVWGTALAAQIVAALGIGSLAALARLTVDSTDAAQGLAVLMREAADAGIRHALDEAGRAGIRTGLVPADVRVDEAALDDAAEATAELMGQGLARAAGKEAARLVGPGADPETIAAQAVNNATASDTPIHDAIQAGIIRGMGAGRAAAQRQLLQTGTKLVPFHTAMLDRGTCFPCRQHDGYEYPDLASSLVDFPNGQYVDCLGRDRCRCFVALRPATP